MTGTPQPSTQKTPPLGLKVMRFVEVPENYGGTYTVTDDTNMHIGTTGLITCLGVYFAIDANRCFCAHINIELQPCPDEEGMVLKNSYFANEKTAKEITEYVLEHHLMPVQQRDGWGVEQPTDLMRRTLVLCSPARNSEEVDLHNNERNIPVSHAAAQAVREFLGIPDEEADQYPVLPYSGFFVRHPLANRDTDITYLESPETPTSHYFGITYIRADGMILNADGDWSAP